MKKIYVIITILLVQFGAFAQQNDSIYRPTIGVNRFIETDQRLKIGGYGEASYSQQFGGDTRHNGELDIHRMVMLFAYKFNSKTSFVTELEFEHVSEVYVEQAFLNYKFSEELQFRGGLVLIPMGIVNEYHESPTFNGVNRPSVDNSIVPTTWREIGAGITGRFLDAGLQYQLYVVNGFKSYTEGAGVLRGSDMLRKGRQKGGESFMSSANVAAKVEYFGIPGLKLGGSVYFGDTQSEAFDGLDKNDKAQLAVADSTVVGVSMYGLDARYTVGGLQVRGQYIMANLSNTDQYNVKTGKDIGAAMNGFYVEAAYNLFQHTNKTSQLLPFVRYENYDTHAKVAGELTANDAYARQEVTAGIGLKITQGTMLKADYNWKKTKVEGSEAAHTINLGIGIMF